MNQDTTYFSLCKNSISGAAVQHRKNHYHFSKHLHASVEIYLIKSGTCVMTIGNTTIECKPDDFIMIPPNVVHSFYLTDENECSFYHIHFFPEFLSHITLEEDSSVNLMHSLIFCCAPFHQQKTTKELKELILAIIRLYNTSQDSTVSANINVYILQLVLLIMQSYKTLSKAQFPEKIQGNYISFTLNYIEHHYMDKILIPDIAKELNISTRYLSKLFSQYMNISLGNYINVYRINRAIELMDTTTLTFTEISGMIGLKDSQHFSKLFYNIIGTTPSQYKKFILKRK